MSLIYERPLVVSSFAGIDCKSRDVHTHRAASSSSVSSSRDLVASEVVSRRKRRDALKGQDPARRAQGRQVGTKKSSQFEGLLRGLRLNEYIRRGLSRVL